MSNHMPFAEHLLRSACIDPETDCWVWVGHLDGSGYGRVGVRGQMYAAHRWVFTEMVGAIPDGFQLDHLCRNPPCVNPGHLEVVTQTENIRRGFRSRSHDPQVTCAKGHPRSIYGRVGASGQRWCQQCQHLYRIAARGGLRAPHRVPCEWCSHLISRQQMAKHVATCEMAS